MSACPRIAAPLLLAGALCLPVGPGSLAQTRFVDDAQRAVELPAQVHKTFAAGFPAEILLYTLAPEKLAGMNHQPAPAALEFFPPQRRSFAPIANLPDRDDPDLDADLLALRADLYVDYGSLHEDYIAVVDAVQARTGIASIILDGDLEQIPAVYRRLGTAIGVAARGEELAAAAGRILAKYRGTLAALPTPPRVYLACSNDGLIACLQGDRGGELVAFLGAVNVAGTRDTAPQRPLTPAEIAAMAPDLVVVSGAATAARLRADPQWRIVPAVAAGRVYAPPELPFNWGSRPPSVNRLPGLIWLSYVLSGRPFDAAFQEDVRSFYRLFYQVDPTPAQLAALAGTR